jgi:hypothetical protein
MGDARYFLMVDKEVLPHVARVVRKAAIKKTGRSLTKAIDSNEKAGETDFPSRTKIVPFVLNDLYKSAEKSNFAIFRSLYLKNRAKQSVGYGGEWSVSEDEDKLYASVYEVSLAHDGYCDKHALIYVSKHALERVSERLGLIDSYKVRNEFVAAIAAISLEWPQLKSGSYYARTRNGLAIVKVVREKDDICVTTWISDEMARPDQLDGDWEVYSDFRDNKGRFSLRVVTGDPVMKLRVLTS